MYLNDLKGVKSFVFDIDGVFTDGSVFITDQGDLLRTMNIRDGYALKKAVASGLRTYVITGGTSEGVEKRMLRLGVTRVISGALQKVDPLKELIDSGEIDPQTTAYMGDDMPDVAVMKMVAFKCCPSDAIPEVQEIADYISPIPGGKGCVRDVLEKWLKLNDLWA